MLTLQQARARYALQKIEEAAAIFTPQNDGSPKEYISCASGLPAMIQMNGLGQAAAFYCSPDRGGQREPHKQLYDLLSEWLTQPDQPYAGQEDLMRGIQNGVMRDYQLAQVEALELLNWVKKFAKAYMED